MQPIIKPYGFLYCIVPLDACLTKKSVGSRMGHGKGSIDLWYSAVTEGMIMFEIKLIHTSGYTKIKPVLVKNKRKLSIRTKVIEQPIQLKV